MSSDLTRSILCYNSMPVENFGKIHNIIKTWKIQKWSDIFGMPKDLLKKLVMFPNILKKFPGMISI